MGEIQFIKTCATIQFVVQLQFEVVMHYSHKCRITLVVFARSSGMKLICSAVGFLLVAASSDVVYALVTSSGGLAGGDHIVGPLDDAFTVDHRGVGRALIDDGSPTPGICTASLLEAGGGRFALTATHCVGDGDSVDVSGVTVEWETDPGVIVTATATAAADQIHVNPFYSTTGDIFAGQDVALLEFDTPVSPSVPRYKLFDGSFDELLVPSVIKVGYGASGFGLTGSTIPAASPPAAGVKRAGLNRWEHKGLGDLLVPFGITAITDNDSQLTYDFDNGASGDPANDAFGTFFAMPDSGGLGPDEVMVGLGDSGGPSFIPLVGGGFAIAGVNSYITRLSSGVMGLELEAVGGASSDVTASVDASWGEFGVDARIANPKISAFIDFVISVTTDFDGDLDVDGADLAIWETSYGVDDGADADGDGDSDGADFLAWQRDAGLSLAGMFPIVAAQAVPEPATLLLVLPAVFFFTSRRKGP